ncbi:MAG: hypothetical protein GX605_11640, partial [Chloroflexi bacterium]|nr:hypothetical protein [Chloroflexota bacterium]
ALDEGTAAHAAHAQRLRGALFLRAAGLVLAGVGALLAGAALLWALGR